VLDCLVQLVAAVRPGTKWRRFDRLPRRVLDPRVRREPVGLLRYQDAHLDVPVVEFEVDFVPFDSPAEVRLYEPGPPHYPEDLKPEDDERYCDCRVEIHEPFVCCKDCESDESC